MYRYTHNDGRQGESDSSVFRAMVNALGFVKTSSVLDTEGLEQSDWIFDNPEKNFSLEVPFKSARLTVGQRIIGTIEVFRQNAVAKQAKSATIRS